MPIGRSEKDRKKMAVDIDGKNAVTHFKVLERYKRATLIELTLETGRTHQIRVHLDYLGHPLIGDTLYDEQAMVLEEGHLLHIQEMKPINQRPNNLYKPNRIKLE